MLKNKTRPAADRQRQWLMGVFTLAVAATASAGEIRHMSVTRSGLLYHVDAEATVDADHSTLSSLITDYHRYNEYTAAITQSTLQMAADGTDPVLTVVSKVCVWVLCRDLIKTSTVHEQSPGSVEFHIVPGEGHFSAGTERLDLVASGHRTILNYQASLKADFMKRAPAFINLWLMKKVIRTELEQIVSGLEHAARAAQSE